MALNFLTESVIGHWREHGDQFMPLFGVILLLLEGWLPAAAQAPYHEPYRPQYHFSPADGDIGRRSFSPANCYLQDVNLTLQQFAMLPYTSLSARPKHGVMPSRHR